MSEFILLILIYGVILHVCKFCVIGTSYCINVDIDILEEYDGLQSFELW